MPTINSVENAEVTDREMRLDFPHAPPLGLGQAISKEK
jgi:hypothetical protein